MNIYLLATSTSSFQLICFFLLIHRLWFLNQHPSDTRLTLSAGHMMPGFLGCLMQSVFIVQLLWNSNGELNLGFSYALLLCTWLLTLLSLIISLSTPLLQILLLLIPANVITIILALAYPPAEHIAAILSLHIQLHILLSIVAYCFLALSAALAILLALKDHQVKQHQFGLLWQTLAPIQTLEILLFRLLSAGFLLLSGGLVIGFIALEKWFTHKVVFSLIAWLVFAVLLSGRLLAGWRGKQAIRLTLTGMSFLLLAFFGSKLVLEIILAL